MPDERERMRQVIAEIDVWLADAAKKRQEANQHPCRAVLTGMGGGAAIFAAGMAFMRLLERG